MVRIGSLFSGAGGLDMAVEEVFGGETVWHCEIDEAASKVLEHRWPGIPNHHDVMATDWHSVERVEVLCGGWPCQPFSLAGKRKGAEDERAVWPYVERAVRMVRPGYVVLENVSAVLGPEFQRVANDLAALGYDIAWTCLRASDVGAPHQRNRLFAIATDTESYGWDERWPKPTWVGGGSDVAVGSDAAVDLLPTPAAARSGRNQSASPGAAIRPSLDMIGELLPTPRTTDSHGAGIHGAGIHGAGGLDLRTTVSLLQTPSVADSVGGHISRSGERGGEMLLPGQARDMAEARWGKYEPAIRRWEALTRPAPPPTELTQRNTHRLSPAFSEWLMGWPAGHVTDVPGLSRSEQLRIIGNGVVPQAASAALSGLALVTQEEPK